MTHTSDNDSPCTDKPTEHCRTLSGVRVGGISEAELGLSDDFHEPMTDDDLLGDSAHDSQLHEPN